jgi:hypothetical protein
LKILSELVLLPNIQIVENCLYLVEVEQALTKKFEAVEGSQYLAEVELALTNNLKILSELILLLPNTDSFQQFENFVRACSTITKY